MTESIDGAVNILDGGGLGDSSSAAGVYLNSYVFVAVRISASRKTAAVVETVSVN